MAKPVAKSSNADKKRLPSAFIERAESLVARKRADWIAEARDDIAIIREKQREIAMGFYDIGLALSRLARPGVVQALDFKHFGEFLETELEMSANRAYTLMSIAKFVRREDALRWGQEKSAALILLAKATKAEDTPERLSRMKKLSLGSGRVLDVASSSANEIKKAARELRARQGGARTDRRGIVVSPADRKLAERLERALHEFGEKRALVTAIARGGAPADLRIERVSSAALSVLERAAVAARKKA